MRTLDVSIEVPEQHDNSLVVQAKSLTITDNASFLRASEVLKAIVGLRKKITDAFAGPKQKAHEAHKAITQLEKDQLTPVAEAESTVKRLIADYQAEQERKRVAEERRLREEAEKAERERRDAEEKARLDAAARLVDQGKPEEAERIVEEAIAEAAQPKIAPVITLPTTTPKVEGIATKKTLKAVITDKQALVKFVAEHPEWLHLVDVNMVAVNGLARTQRQALRLPGVEVREESQVAVR